MVALKFWTRTGTPLPQLADALVHAGAISSYQYDYENVYEWVEASLCSYNATLNISRLHHDFCVASNLPEVFVLISRHINADPDLLQSWTHDTAKIVSDCLHCPVEIGTVKHLGDDEYLYQTSKTLLPNG